MPTAKDNEMLGTFKNILTNSIYTELLFKNTKSKHKGSCLALSLCSAKVGRSLILGSFDVVVVYDGRLSTGGI